MDTSTTTSLDTTNRPGATAQDPDDPVMTAKEAAAFLGVSPWTLYAAASRHEVPHRRLGRRLLFLRSALKAWLRGANPRNAT